MDSDDLSAFRYAAGASVGFFPLLVALIGWYFPRWRRGFFTTYRKTDPARIQEWDRWAGIVALLLAVALVGIFLVYLEVTVGEGLLSSDFFTGLREGLVIGVVSAGVVVTLLMAARKVVMLARGVRRYDPRERMNLTQARRMANEELDALGARLSAAQPGEPGRERAEEYLEFARKLFAAARPGRSVFIANGGTGVLEAVSAVVLCRVARSALEQGKPLAEEQILCFFNPLHGPSQGTRELSMGGRDPRRAYPLCHSCLEHVLAEPEEKVVQRRLTVPALMGSHPDVTFTSMAFGGPEDIRPIKLLSAAKNAMESADRLRRH